MDATSIIDLIERALLDGQRIINGVRAGSLSPEEAAAQWEATRQGARQAVEDYDRAKDEKGIA